MASASAIYKPMRAAHAILWLLVVFGAGVGAASAQRADPAKQYETCMTLTQKQPDEAYEMAGGWIDRGGGPPAEHCQAVALVGLGRYAEAAEHLERLAGDARVKSTPLPRAALGQAVQAWLLAGDNAHAVAAATAALKMTPNDADLLVDRSIGYAGGGQYWEAVDDLNRAIELQPKRPDAYVFRGAAYRLLESFDLAREDMDKAISLDRNNPEAWLESGILKRLANDKAGARQAWMKVLELAPNSPAADAARGNIEKMDVKTQ
jgi:tetratricopeptide (TPR) repeat protein